MTTIGELRIALAEAKIALRQAKDAHDISKAIAETNAIEGGVNGKNAEERTRNLTVALLEDNAYSNVLILLRDAEAKVDRLTAQIAVEEDAVRLNEARIREKLADALMGKRVDDATADCTCDECRSKWTHGQTAEDVAWHQHMGTYDIPDYSDPVFPAGSNAGGEYPR